MARVQRIYFDWSERELCFRRVSLPLDKVVKSREMSDDFLPRAHSKRLGELERSNWKSLRDGRNIHRIDPAIREIVTSLNRKGYGTCLSCSGGYPVTPGWKVDRR